MDGIQSQVYQNKQENVTQTKGEKSMKINQKMAWMLKQSQMLFAKNCKDKERRDGIKRDVMV